MEDLACLGLYCHISILGNLLSFETLLILSFYLFIGNEYFVALVI